MLVTLTSRLGKLGTFLVLNAPKCHPNTCVAVINSIIDSTGFLGRSNLTLWFYGSMVPQEPESRPSHIQLLKYARGMDGFWPLFFLEDSVGAQQYCSIHHHNCLSNRSCNSSLTRAYWSRCGCRPHDFPLICGCPARKAYHRTSSAPPIYWIPLQRLPFFHRHRWPRWVSGNQHTVRVSEASDSCILSLSTPYLDGMIILFKQLKMPFSIITRWVRTMFPWHSTRAELDSIEFHLCCSATQSHSTLKTTCVAIIYPRFILVGCSIPSVNLTVFGIYSYYYFLVQSHILIWGKGYACSNFCCTSQAALRKAGLL